MVKLQTRGNFTLHKSKFTFSFRNITVWRNYFPQAVNLLFSGKVKLQFSY